jgi:hypothetical protein
MKWLKSIFLVLAAALVATGCQSDYGTGSPYQPGPPAGKAVGTGVGVVVGNVAGFGVGVAEGATAGTAAVFNPNYRVVRVWRTETTVDGRHIQVPYDQLVDKDGRPVKAPSPTGYPAPVTATNSAAK